MNKTDVTAAFEQSSFLYGANAKFVEELYAKFKADPAAVDAPWRQFFASLDDGMTPARPSWENPNWPAKPADELTAALDGNWAAFEKTLAPKI